MQPAAGSRQQAGDSRQGQSASTSAHKWPLGIVTLQAPAKIGYAFGSTAADAVWEVGTPLDVHGGTSGSCPFGLRQHKHIGASGDTSSGADGGRGCPRKEKRAVL